ncbi:MAG: hypothetical protein V1776_02255 [Candidatus Diapherotrites archaeon]
MGEKEKPSPLFLSIVAGIGTALLSPIAVSGEPVVVLIIPIALVAAYLHTANDGILVAVGGSLLAGLTTYSIMNWEIISYALAAGISVIGMTSLFSKTSGKHVLIFGIVGTILFQLLFDLQAGQNILLRPEEFLGTYPGAGIRILANLFITSIALNIWEKNN